VNSRYMESRKGLSHWIEGGSQPSISPKVKFQNLGNHRGRGTIVGCSLESRKAKISGNR
jgi:hypothetical protein